MHDDALPRASSPAVKHHVLAWCVLLAVACALAWVTWLGWGHPIVDLGREVYVPSQLREGRLLYRDITYNYGPIAPYAAAALTAVFGDTLTVHAWWGAAIGLATMAGLYVLGCLLGVRMVGFAAALLFVLFSFFAHSTIGCNYVLPYAQAATLSMAMAIWSLQQLMVYLYRGRRLGPLLVGAALMLAAVFTKQEVGAAIAVTWLVAAWAHRAPWRDVAIVAVMGAMAVGVFVVVFGEAGWREMTKLIGAASAGSFFDRVSGVSQWTSALAATAVGTGGVAAVMVLASRARSHVFWTVAAVIGIAVAFRYTDAFVFRAALPLAAFAILWCVVTGRRRDPLLLVAVLTIACCPRVWLRFDPRWYGFYLYVPAYLLITYGLGVWLVSAMRRPRMVLTVLVAVALITAGRTTIHTLAVQDAKRDVIVTSKGAMRVFAIGHAEVIEACLAYLRDHAKPTDTLVVLPEGVMLNWWSGLSNPTAFYTFIPPELTDAGVRQRIVSELEQTRPTYVAIVVRPLLEFDVTSLEQYMPEVMAVVGRDYKLVRLFRESGKDRWRMALLERQVDKAEQ